MKNLQKILLLGILGLMTAACSKKEDAPKPNYPHVAGAWSGNGTDDAIGYFTFGVPDMLQTSDQGVGSFVMNSAIGTVKGDFSVIFGPSGGNNVKALTLTRKTWTIGDPQYQNRVCQATMTVTPGSTFITGSAVSFHYTMTDCQGGTWSGGANLHKDAGMN